MEPLEIFPDGMNPEDIDKMINTLDDLILLRNKKITISSKYGNFSGKDFKFQEVLGPYGKTKLPAEMRYVMDNSENRELLSKKFGPSKLSNIKGQTYLEINLDTKEWNTSFDFCWLYTNNPPLTPINEILSIQ